jgi:hypothetical protein
MVLALLLINCSEKVRVQKQLFDLSMAPPAPDYRNPAHWASLPGKADAADSVPRKSALTNRQAEAKADVFFIYPTIFHEIHKKKYQWNADVNNEKLNRQIQLTTILNQASVFNGSCKIYSPYYRQAHLAAFHPPFRDEGSKALELAYQDIKTAFEYYLENYNHGRPIIIASHSQGSYHAERLLKEYFDGKELQKQLVAAYLVGKAIKPDAFANIHPTAGPDEVGVWASWNTFEKNYVPENYEQELKGALCTNPLLWNSSPEIASKEMNHGGVALRFTFAPQLVDAQAHDGILWVNRPNFKGSFLMRTKIWHRADINFFYVNIRENVAGRIDRFVEGAMMAVGKN